METIPYLHPTGLSIFPDFLRNSLVLALDKVVHSMMNTAALGAVRKTTSINYIEQEKTDNCLVPGISKQSHILEERSLSYNFSTGKQNKPIFSVSCAPVRQEALLTARILVVLDVSQD